MLAQLLVVAPHECAYGVAALDAVGMSGPDGQGQPGQHEPESKRDTQTRGTQGRSPCGTAARMRSPDACESCECRVRDPGRRFDESGQRSYQGSAQGRGCGLQP